MNLATVNAKISINLQNARPKLLRKERFRSWLN